MNEIRELKQKVSILEQKVLRNGEKQKVPEAKLKNNIDHSQKELSQAPQSKRLKWVLLKRDAHKPHLDEPVKGTHYTRPLTSAAKALATSHPVPIPSFSKKTAHFGKRKKMLQDLHLR